MIVRKLSLVLLTLLLAGVSLAWAGEKPAVQVVFEFAENGYRKQLARQAAVVERVAREKLLQDLNDRLPFLRFTADPQNIVLRVRLGNANAGSEMHAVNFQVFVEGKDSTTNRPLHSPVVIWSYRSATAYESPLGSGAALGADIGLRFQQGDHDELVRKALRVIALSHEGMLVQSSPVPVWVIPFTQADLCMDFPSYLEIEDELHTTTGNRSDEFRVKANGVYNSTDPASPPMLQHRIEGIPGDPPPDQSISLNDLRSIPTEKNKVLSVYVVGYMRRSPSCSEVVDPPNFAPTGAPQ